MFLPKPKPSPNRGTIRPRHGRINGDLLSFWEQQHETKKVEERKHTDNFAIYYNEFEYLGLAQIKEALTLFDTFDKDKNGYLDKREYAELMKETLPSSNENNPLFERLVHLSFEAIDTNKSGSIDKREFLCCYTDMFCNERRQMALLLSGDFPGLSLEQLELILSKFEELDQEGFAPVGIDECYQLKHELVPTLSAVLKGSQAEDIVTRHAKKGPTDELEVDSSHFRQAFFALSNTFQLPTRINRPQASAPTRSPRANPARTDANAVFNDLVNASTMGEVMQFSQELRLSVGANNSYGLAVYEAIKAKTDNRQAKLLWQLLDLRAKQVEYRSPLSRNARVIVVGAGPAGLRTAIECLLLGARVTIIEKRYSFSRCNLLHVWDASIRDLRNIGAKILYPKFCIGGINHVSIKRLQILLLQLALLLGAQFAPGIEFERVVAANASIAGNTYYHKVQVRRIPPSQADTDVPSSNLADSDLLCNVLIGADGEHTTVAQSLDFERKVTQGSRALGITANFVCGSSKEEKNIREFGLLAAYSQDYFQKLNAEHGIDLENLVYYRGDTHYFVMTAKAPSLVKKGVCKQAYDKVDDLLSHSNVQKNKLEAFVREVANYVTLPSSCPFEQTASGTPDVALFDFSRKQQVVLPFKVQDQGNRSLLVLMVGDAGVAPFWPLGTGCNRAIQAALDAVWTVKQFFEAGMSASNSPQWTTTFKMLVAASPADLVSNFGLHTINPATRYINLPKTRA